MVTIHGKSEGKSMALIHGTELTAFEGRNPDDFINDAVQVHYTYGKKFEDWMKKQK